MNNVRLFIGYAILAFWLSILTPYVVVTLSPFFGEFDIVMMMAAAGFLFQVEMRKRLSDGDN